MTVFVVIAEYDCSDEIGPSTQTEIVGVCRVARRAERLKNLTETEDKKSCDDEPRLISCIIHEVIVD